MGKYTHRIKISREEIDEIWYEYAGENATDILLRDYYKNGYLYGYFASGYLLGDIVEVNDEYINFEYWWPIGNRKVESL